MIIGQPLEIIFSLILGILCCDMMCAVYSLFCDLLLLLGDDRNIQRVFVAGRDVTPSMSSAIRPVVPVIVLCMIQLVLAVLY